MNLEEYKLRLQLLLEQDVITSEAHEVGLKAFNKFANELNKTDISQAEMLFTHLPMALTRIENGEEVDAPAPEIMREIEESSYYELAKEHVAFIEDLWKKPLPKGEQEYLYMHYTTVLNSNIQGEELS